MNGIPESYHADIRLIADHYGVEHQLFKTFEELGELVAALSKGDDEALASEIADVKIMIAQMEHLLGIEARVNECVRYKILRQMRRMLQEK